MQLEHLNQSLQHPQRTRALKTQSQARPDQCSKRPTSPVAPALPILTWPRPPSIPGPRSLSLVCDPAAGPDAAVAGRRGPNGPGGAPVRGASVVVVVSGRPWCGMSSPRATPAGPEVAHGRAQIGPCGGCRRARSAPHDGIGRRGRGRGASRPARRRRRGHRVLPGPDPRADEVGAHPGPGLAVVDGDRRPVAAGLRLHGQRRRHGRSRSTRCSACSRCRSCSRRRR